MPDLSRTVASTCIAASYSLRLLHRTLTSASNGRERDSNQWAEFMDELIGPNLGPKMSCNARRTRWPTIASEASERTETRCQAGEGWRVGQQAGGVDGTQGSQWRFPPDQIL